MKKFLNYKEQQDDMSELEKISQNLEGIKFEKIIHPIWVADSKTTIIEECKNNPEVLYDYSKKRLGYSIISKWQFLYSKGNKIISCIRGFVSFGKYEICEVENIDKMEDSIERFETAEETLIRIKELLDGENYLA